MLPLNMGSSIAIQLLLDDPSNAATYGCNLPTQDPDYKTKRKFKMLNNVIFLKNENEK